MTSRWPRITTTTLADQVYDVLRTRIVRGELEPGEFIREQEVSQALGVSRTPVREALGRLASEGFAERIPHRGFRVPTDSIDELLELYPIVSALEALAAESAFPQLTAADIQHLGEVHERFEAAVAEDDPPTGIELNREFHHLLSQKCGNQKLLELLDDLRSQIVRLELWSFAHISNREDSVAQHAEIVRAIREQDFPGAIRVLQENRMQTYHEFSTGASRRVQRPARADAADGGAERAAASR